MSIVQKDLGADKADETYSTAAPDTNHEGDPRIANQDGRVENQQLPASTLTPGRDGGNLASECGGLWPLEGRCLFPVPIALRGHTHGGSTGVRSEQLGRNTSDLRPVSRDSTVRIQGEHEDRESGVQHHSEVTSERTPDSGWDDGDADDLVRSERSKGEP